MNDNKEVDVNYRVYHKDGHIIWLNLHGRRMGDSNGFPSFFAIYHNLSTSMELYQQILDEAEDALIVVDRTTHELLFANNASSKIAKRPFESTTGVKCHEYLKGIDSPCKICLAGQLKDKPLSQPVDFDNRHYISRITRINWNGRDAYINCLSDRTESWNKEKFISKTLKRIPDGIAVFRIEEGHSICEYLSESASKLLGFDIQTSLPDKYLGINIRIHPDDAESVHSRISQAIMNHEPINIDFRMVIPSGNTVWINLTSNPHISTDKTLRYYSVYSDVTERKQNEETLRSRELEYAAALQSGTQVYRYYIEGRVGKFSSRLYNNKTNSELIEIPEMPAFMVKQGFIAPDGINTWLQFYSAIDQGDKSGHMDIQMNTSDQGWRWIHSEFTGIRDNNNVPVSAVICYSDVTDEREGFKYSAFEHEGLLSALNTVYYAIIACNISKNHYQILRYEQNENTEQIKKDSIDQFITSHQFMIHSEDREAVTNTFSRSNLLQAFSKNNQSIKLEYRQHDQKGSLHWVETVATQVNNPNDDDVLVLIVSRRIDEQKKAEEKLNQALTLTSGQLSNQINYDKLINDFAPSLIMVRYLDQKDSIYVTGNLGRSMGYQDEEIKRSIGNYFQDIVIDEDANAVKNCINKVITERPKNYQYEFRVKKKGNGKICWIMGRGSRFVDISGRTGYIHVFTDVTNRHLLIDTLEKNKQIMTRVVEQSERIFYYYDAIKNTASGINQKKCKENGLEPNYENLPDGARLIGFNDPENEEPLNAFFKHAKEGTIADNIKLHLHSRTGEDKWFDCRCTPIIHDGVFQQGAVLSFMDVTANHDRAIIYAKHLQSIQSDYLAKGLFFETDLTTGIVERTGGKLLPEVTNFIGMQHDAVVDTLLAQNVYKDSIRTSIRINCNKEHLLSVFTEGENEFEQDVPSSIANFPAVHWIRLTVQLVEDPYTKHVKAFSLIRDITDEKERLLDIQRKAELDGMTGLYNHMTTEHTITNMLSSSDQQNYAFLLFDLDNLKYINDHYGHLQGDRALECLAKTLKSHFRKTDIIGRVGGDEFVALLSGVSDESTLTPSLRNLLSRLSNIHVGNNDEYALHCSIGCTFCKSGSDDFQSAYQRADIALYQVKRNSKNDFAFYSPKMLKDHS